MDVSTKNIYKIVLRNKYHIDPCFRGSNDFPDQNLRQTGQRVSEL